MDPEIERDADGAEYWHSYGLDCDPFASAAIEGLYFPGGDRGELLQTAAHIAQYSRQPVVFYGAEGVGKTTLLNAVASSVDDATMAMKLQAGFMTTREQIFAEIANTLSMTDVNYIPAAFREQVGVALSKMDEGKTSLLLLVDDAHELIDKSLHALRELAEEESSVIRVLFFASTDGNGFLRPELDRSDVQQLAIQPLDREGIKDYLLYRLSTAGYDQVEFPFTDADVDSILKQSLGIPARIGRVAEQKLRQKSRLDGIRSADQIPMQVKPPLPWGHALLAAGLLAGILLVVFWGTSETRRSGGELQSPLAVDNELGELDQEVDELEARAAELIAEDDIAINDPVDVNGEPAEQESDLTEVLAGEPAVIESPEPFEPQALDSQPIDDAAAEQQLAVNDLPVAETIPVDEPTPVIVEPEIVEPQTVEPEIVEPAPVVVLEADQPANTGSVYGMTDFERELLNMPETTHTLQLLSGGSEAAMMEFVRKHADQDVRFYKRLKNGQPSYVAVVGRYSTANEARAAVSSLPAALSRGQPWPRSLGSIQTEIRDARTP